MKKLLLFMFLITFPSVCLAQGMQPSGVQDEGGTISRPVTTNDCVGVGIACSHSGVTSTFTVGGAAGFIIPNGSDPDVNADGMISWDTNDDALRGYDGTNQVVVGQKSKILNVTITKPLDLDEAATLPIWQNRSGFTFNIIGIESNSDTDDTVYALNESSATDYGSLTLIGTITIDTNGTGVFTSTDTSLSHSVIENDNVISFNNDSADDPDYINFSIEGYFDANVD